MSTKLYDNIHHKDAVWAQIGQILNVKISVSSTTCR